MSALDIAHSLLAPTSKPATDILGSANSLTAALCTLAPTAPVCAQADIKALEPAKP
jgi:hypothetical protein